MNTSRFLARCLILGVFFFAGTHAHGNEVEEAMEEYRLLQQLRKELKATINDPTKDKDVRLGARTNLDRLEKVQIPAIVQRLDNLGVKITRAKAGDPVIATDRPVAAQKKGTVASHCDRYAEYVRPNTSLYKLPPLDRQSGKQRSMAKLIVKLEDELIRHLTRCEKEWNKQEATEWPKQLDDILRKLTELEVEYAMTFAGPYTDKEDRALAKIYSDRPEFHRLAQEEPRLYEEYQRRKAEWEDIVKRYGPYPPLNPTAALQLKQIEQAYLRARNAWRETSTRMNDILRRELEPLRKIRDQRAQRGIENMKELHPGTVYSLHEPSSFLQFTKVGEQAGEIAPNPFLIRMIGKDGWDILISEGARRYSVIKQG